jgi:hypothetical protein
MKQQRLKKDTTRSGFDVLGMYRYNDYGRM